MHTTLRRSKAFAAVAILLLLRGATVAADDVHVMTSGAFTAAYLVLAPRFERATGHRVITETTSSGVGAASIEARLAAGQSADVVIVSETLLERLISERRVVTGSRVDLAQSAIGLAVRHGAPKPDISSVDALRRTLLAARSIAYSASVSGTYVSTEMLQRLGIAEQVMPKSRRIDNERVGAVVARGEAELGFQQISELLPVPGIDFVGPLPPEVQKVSTFAAGVAVASRAPGAARLLIEFLASPAAESAIRESALEPIGIRLPAAAGATSAH